MVGGVLSDYDLDSDWRDFDWVLVEYFVVG